MIAHARQPRVHVAAAELLGADFLAGRGAHQRRPRQKNRPLLAHDDVLVAHRGHVRAARRATAHHHRDLRDAHRRHPRLVVEDAPEVVAVGKHLRLQRQKRAARIDQVNARQPILDRDLLRAQMLLHRHRIVGAAFDRRVVRDHDHRLAPVHPADASDDARAGRLAAVHPVRRERREFEERAAGRRAASYPVAREQLAALDVPLARRARDRPARTRSISPRSRLTCAVHRLAVSAEFL